MKPLDLSPDAPWKRRFRAWTAAPLGFAEARPERALAVTNRSGVMQLCAWDTGSGELTQLTDRPHGKAMGAIDPLGRWVYYLHDEGGNEIGHVVRVPFAGGAAEDITPEMPPYAWSGIAFSRDGATIALATATREGFRVHVAALDAARRFGAWGERFHTPALLRGIALSADGSLLAVGSTERSGTLDSSIVVLESGSGERVAELVPPAGSANLAAFSPLAGDQRLLGTSSESGYDRPFLWEPVSGARREIDPEGVEGELAPTDWSADGRRLLLRQFVRAVQRLLEYDLEAGTWRWLKHPRGTLGAARFGAEGELWLSVQDSTQPGRVLAIDEESGAVRRVLLEGEPAPAGLPWRSFEFPSTKGATIQGWVAVPPGEGPFPTILETHGGPSAVMTEIFHRQAQAWLDHGFAFATINYRGSVSFGHAFQHAIDGDLGNLEVDDMAAAREWLVDEGIADAGRILVTGWSYGGYLTLQALGRRPELWAGGMAGIAIADWRLMYEDQAETLRRYQVALFGGTPEERPEEHAKASPITYADRVRAPLLVIQGANDTRCPARQLKAYEERLLELGKEIRVHWFDAGHGSYQVEQQIEHQELMLRFASEVLGER